MPETAAPTVTTLVTVRRSSHPEFTYFTTTEMFLDGAPAGTSPSS